MPRLVVFQKDLGCCLNRIGKNSPYVAGIILYRTAYTLNIGNSDIILLVEKHLELVSGGEKVHSFLVDFCEIGTGTKHRSSHQKKTYDISCFHCHVKIKYY